MTDPTQAAMWLIVAAFVVLVLCLGGTLIAAGLLRRPAPREAPSTRPGPEESQLHVQ